MQIAYEDEIKIMKENYFWHLPVKLLNGASPALSDGLM